MNSEEQSNNKNISTGLILACIFSSPHIKYSSEFMNLGGKNDENAYSVNIEYIKYLINCINKLYIMDADKDPILKNYRMNWQKDSNSITIKRVIDIDKRLKAILAYRGNYIIYTGKKIVLEKFVDENDPNLIWYAGKMTLYANRIIEEKAYGNDNVLKGKHF